jgi:hypothetical protein
MRLAESDQLECMAEAFSRFLNALQRGWTDDLQAPLSHRSQLDHRPLSAARHLRAWI